ncbi:hypothetical protein B0H17DRAFT_1149049 [Mycena rosella]|uniref:Uncharacterized protein n=1 Tax=Mycena rosella TaxID=1033263 RepID=A0AAD7FS88_MYCRO|nr:hypothetical protein B0H17DRAFT_1149049 [Mycena rosella]
MCSFSVSYACYSPPNRAISRGLVAIEEEELSGGDCSCLLIHGKYGLVPFIAPMVRRSEWFRRKMDSWRREALLGLVPAGSEQIAARSASEPRGLVHEFGRLVERQNIIEGGASILRASSFGWWL